MYYQNGLQSAGRPFLDGPPASVQPNDDPPPFRDEMEKMKVFGGADRGTNAPSTSFMYAFDKIRYWVRDEWDEVLSHTDDGTVVSGSLDELVAAFEVGAEMKVGIRGLCNDLAEGSGDVIDHEAS